MHKFVTLRVKEASAAIMQYGQRYETTMSTALAQHRQGAWHCHCAASYKRHLACSCSKPWWLSERASDTQRSRLPLQSAAAGSQWLTCWLDWSRHAGSFSHIAIRDSHRHTAGEEARAAAAAFAEGRLEAVAHLLAGCEAVNERIAALADGVPSHADEVGDTFLVLSLRWSLLPKMPSHAPCI